MDGFGIFVEGDYKYQGHWSEGKPHGFGREFFQNGDVYRGNFIKGIKEGEGCVYWYNQESEF